MEMITLTTAYATATVSPYGAQVMSFVPHSGHDVLWQSTPEHLAAARAAGKPLRGGVPLCWPWFRGHPTDATQPSHGFARTSVWEVEELTVTEALSRAVLALRTDTTTPGFPHKTKAVLTATLTDKLTLALTTTNLGDKPLPLSQALHSYLRLSAVENARLEGLEGLTRVHISPGTEQPPLTGDLTVTEEVEHLFGPVTKPLALHDSGYPRVVGLVQEGGEQTVVWNPWADKAKALDMPADGYKTMLCVEAANVSVGPIRGALTLKPGAAHTLTQTLRIA